MATWTKRKSALPSQEHDRNNKERVPLFDRIEETLDYVKETFSDCDDLTIRPVTIGKAPGYLLYMNVIVNDSLLNGIEERLSELRHSPDPERTDESATAQPFDRLQAAFPLSQATEEDDLNQVIDAILYGMTVLLLDGAPHALRFQTVSSDGRGVDEPVTEQVVRGPREGFVEQLNTNVMLIRRRIRSPDLKARFQVLGSMTRTGVAVLYVQGIADDAIVHEIHDRLRKIELESVLESNYIEQCLQDAKWSPFPQLYTSERPDRICAGLLEGKVAIVTEGTPFVLLAPALFVEFLHSNEDYYDGSLPSTFIRWVRTLGLLISCFLPAFYVAITTIHQDLLQTPLLIRISGFREDLPYPILIEALFMQLIFELVREAGLRMPKAIGNAVTIVGTLVIGQAAVQAGLVGALMVIVVAVTALTTFVLPNYAFMQVVRIISFPMLLLGGMFGFMGIIVGLMFVLAHLCSLRSVGVPYLTPLSPARRTGWADVFWQSPWWAKQTSKLKSDSEQPASAGPSDTRQPQPGGGGSS
ncbi:spore germination protein [Paenibacillus methanolicus]|uniref:Spore germination protein KA n=1 Tax=Paenibacillus methanolicus TaxID=582686 RepID=A0A5S5CHJ4_9BACL|nr:spore germination protein [Paenibacillus methanolicus]TYP79256.1 spore germination protein KA [Paenibacillus methanolicus]